MRRCKWKNNSLLKNKTATIKITAISSRYESVECWELPRSKENGMEEKPLTQAGGCSIRPDSPEGKGYVLEKPCLAQSSSWNKKKPKNRKAGAHKALLVGDAGCWPCLGQLWISGVNVSASAWLAGPSWCWHCSPMSLLQCREEEKVPPSTENLLKTSKQTNKTS